MPMLEDAKKSRRRSPVGRARPAIISAPSCAIGRRVHSVSRTMELFPTIRNGRSSFIAGQCGFRKSRSGGCIRRTVRKQRVGRFLANGIYDYVHYHSRIHEVLGIARGEGNVQFGGHLGGTLKLKAGDVAVLPAGTGHQCLSASKDFLVIGAYPPSGKYDECTTSEDHERALSTIPKVGRPRKDPVYGTKGPLLKAWPSMR